MDCERRLQRGHVQLSGQALPQAAIPSVVPHRLSTQLHVASPHADDLMSSTLDAQTGRLQSDKGASAAGAGASAGGPARSAAALPLPGPLGPSCSQLSLAVPGSPRTVVGVGLGAPPASRSTCPRWLCGPGQAQWSWCAAWVCWWIRGVGTWGCLTRHPNRPVVWSSRVGGQVDQRLHTPSPWEPGP